MTVTITEVLEHNCRDLLFQGHENSHSFLMTRVLYFVDCVLEEDLKAAAQMTELQLGC